MNIASYRPPAAIHGSAGAACEEDQNKKPFIFLSLRFFQESFNCLCPFPVLYVPVSCQCGGLAEEWPTRHISPSQSTPSDSFLPSIVSSVQMSSSNSTLPSFSRKWSATLSLPVRRRSALLLNSPSFSSTIKWLWQNQVNNICRYLTSVG